MRKIYFYVMLIAAFALPASAQRMLDVSDDGLSAFNSTKAVTVSESQIVEEGRVWRYHSDYNANMTPSEDIYVDVCLSGVTEIDGKEYLNCYVWKTENEFSEESAVLIAYMREENGKVYVRYVSDAEMMAMEKGISIIPWAPIVNLYRHDWGGICVSPIFFFSIAIWR